MSFLWSATIIQLIFVLGVVFIVYFFINMNNKIKKINSKLDSIERKLDNN